MSDARTIPPAPAEEKSGGPNVALIAAIALGVLTVLLIAAAVLLAFNAERAAPVVEIIRDVIVIVIALEFAVIGAALVVFLVQVSRFINLMNNEVKPILDSAQDTANALRGTAIFVNRHATRPIIDAAAALGGFSRVMKDTNRIREATGIALRTATDKWHFPEMPDVPSEDGE